MVGMGIPRSDDGISFLCADAVWKLLTSCALPSQARKLAIHLPGSQTKAGPPICFLGCWALVENGKEKNFKGSS